MHLESELWRYCRRIGLDRIHNVDIRAEMRIGVDIIELVEVKMLNWFEPVSYTHLYSFVLFSKISKTSLAANFCETQKIMRDTKNIAPRPTSIFFKWFSQKSKCYIKVVWFTCVISIYILTYCNSINS